MTCPHRAPVAQNIFLGTPNPKSVTWQCFNQSEKIQTLRRRPTKVRGLTKAWFPKGWFWRMFPRNETGTRVHADVPPERRLERGHIRQNHPFQANFGAFFVRKFVAQTKKIVQNSLCRRATLTVSRSKIREEFVLPKTGPNSRRRKR